MTDPILLAAPAKLNLFLEVVGKRADGYHDLVTVMTTIDLADRVFVRRVPGRKQGDPRIVLCADPEVTARPDQNLAHRAAAALLPADAPFTVEIGLMKRIPSQAGLGGGSSDAATVLKVVNEMLDTPRTAAELNAIAAGLGADVPFFLTGGTALCEGIGERVTPIPEVPPLTFVLAIPEIPVSTAAVFGSADLDLTSPRRGGSLIADGLAHADPTCLAAPEAEGGIFNRLAPVAFALEPELADLARRLELVSGRRFHMTGSGSGLYTFCAGGVAEGNRVMFACESTAGVSAFHLVTTLPTAPGA